MHKISKKNILENPPQEISIELKIPEKVDTYRKLATYLWKNFGIDLATSGEDEGNLYWNPDMRSMMGFVEEFTGNYVSLIIFPKYYAQAKPDEWKKLVSEGKIKVTE